MAQIIPFSDLKNNSKSRKSETSDCKVYKGKPYVFYKVSNDKHPGGTHHIKEVYEGRLFNYDPCYHSLFIGQLYTLFGKPDYLTTNNEDLLSYVVAAEDKNGKIIYLEVYYGPSGPAIGGLDGEEYILAANELEKIIMAAKPTDFEIESTYEDVGVTIKMGVKHGRPYYDNIFPDGFFDM